MNRQLRAAFERYWQERMGRADALTPGQKKALVHELRRELSEEGRVVLASGPVKVDPQQPIVRAALEGRPVSVGGGKVIEKAPRSVGDRMEALPLPLKLAVMSLVLLLPCLVMGFVVMRGDEEEAVVVSTPTVTPTLTPSPTPKPGEPTPTVHPVITPTILVATPTPYAIALMSGSAAPSGNDPASLEMGGFSYVLSVGQVQNGQWVPTGAQWLAGTELRRVIALPYEPDVANTITALRAGTVLKLRLRSGEIVKYRVSQVARVKRHEIEGLAGRTPSLAVLLHGEPSGERWLVLADAIQEPQDFGTYTAGVPGSEAAPELTLAPTPAAIPTLIPTLARTVYTDSRSVTNAAVGLTLTVGECETVARIGELEPDKNSQRFYICPITFQADAGGPGAPYSGQMVGITELSEIQTSADWFPAPVRIRDALGEGALSPGGSVTGNVAGVVGKGSSFGNKSDPVLIWEQAGIRYVLQLKP